MGQVQLVTSTAAFMIFVIAITTFAVNFGEENNALNIANDTSIKNLSDSTNNQVSVFLEESDSAGTSFYNSTIDPGDETTVTGGQFKVGLTGPIKAVTNTASTAYSTIFGTDSGFAFIFTIFSASFGIVVFLLIWKTWKSGVSD